jgi:hypothetical protein
MFDWIWRLKDEYERTNSNAEIRKKSYVIINKTLEIE